MNMFKDVNRIIFDLDNTLIKHNFKAESTAIRKYLGIEQVNAFNAQLQNMFQNNIEYVRWMQITESCFGIVIEKYMPILREYRLSGRDVMDAIHCIDINQCSLMQGAKGTLEYLYNKNYELVVLTNWFYNHQVNMLKHLGIFDYFERIYTWDNYYPKPNKLAMKRALNSTVPSKNVMIGDDPIGDIEFAKSCGVKAIGFNIDYNKLQNASTIQKADVNITSLKEIRYYL